MAQPRGGPPKGAETEAERTPDPAPAGGTWAEPAEVRKPYLGFRLVPGQSGVAHVGGQAWYSRFPTSSSRAVPRACPAASPPRTQTSSDCAPSAYDIVATT